MSNSHNQEVRLTFTSDRERKTSDDTLRTQLDYIAGRGISGNRGRGWDYELLPIESSGIIPSASNNLTKWRFTCTIRFYRRVEIDPTRFQRQAGEIVEWASAAGHNARFGSRKWIAIPPANMLVIPGNSVNEPSDDHDDLIDDSYTVTPLNEVGVIRKGKFFDHLYGLDSQITIMLSALQAASDSNMRNRFHALAFGDAGCGKTEILLSVARLLRSLGVHHLSLDATSTTEAGMRKNFLDPDNPIPEVILIEEIEKVPEASLRWLLGVMDVRAEISQANYRMTASRKVPSIILATANDMDLLKRMMYGALHSRFHHEVYCPRPSREVLVKILEREILKINGDTSWIEPTLSFMYDERGITDPRKIIPVCLCGKESLLDGSYQGHLRSTMKPETLVVPVLPSHPNVDIDSL